MICTLWTPFQAERDWKNSYREILLIPLYILFYSLWSIPIYLYPFIHLSISFYPSFYIYLSIFLYLFIHLSISIYPSIYIYLSIYLYIFIHLSISIYPSIYIYLSIILYIFWCCCYFPLIYGSQPILIYFLVVLNLSFLISYSLISLFNLSINLSSLIKIYFSCHIESLRIESNVSLIKFYL